MKKENKFMKHPYTHYRPKWCIHPEFCGMDYCWGLAVLVDGYKKANMLDKLNKELKEYCKGCEFNKFLK